MPGFYSCNHDVSKAFTQGTHARTMHGTPPYTTVCTQGYDGDSGGSNWLPGRCDKSRRGSLHHSLQAAYEKGGYLLVLWCFGLV